VSKRRETLIEEGFKRPAAFELAQAADTAAPPQTAEATVQTQTAEATVQTQAPDASIPTP
jgi:3-deoxy-7-phosphoheptulonate synthase